MTLQTTQRRPTSTCRVAIVDDHTMFADSLARVLEGEDDIELVGVASTAAAGVAIARDSEPDVVILDFVLTDAKGEDAIASILQASPATRVLVVTGFGDRRVLTSAIRAGCSGFITKGQAAAELVDAVRKLRDGDIHIPPDLFDTLPELHSTGSQHVSQNDWETGLTGREGEVLACLSRGMTTIAIAESLGVTVNTVRTHIQKVITKLGAHSKLQAVTMAMRAGIVDMPH